MRSRRRLARRGAQQNQEPAEKREMPVKKRSRGTPLANKPRTSGDRAVAYALVYSQRANAEVQREIQLHGFTYVAMLQKKVDDRQGFLIIRCIIESV
jgi:hypothetical protein